MYGCLGFGRSRFFAQHLAALITEKGREILLNTKSVLEKLGFLIIYGDTDSIVISTNSCDYNEVYQIGVTIKQHINKIYRNIELDIDGVYKYLLLLKKKKYAALTVAKTTSGDFVYKPEMKGLDIVRRDWSKIACVSGQFVVDEVLSGKPLEESIDLIHGYMEKLRQDFESNVVPLAMLEVTKQVTKGLNEYADGNSLPHVMVAARMNKERQRHYKRGDMISYIICLDGTEEPAMKRAYHIDEITAKPELKVDTKYYLEQQIHPVISRLIGPIEGTDSVRIAELLGLDGTKFKKAIMR
jgi:DNA polymerase alpha subunit A